MAIKSKLKLASQFPYAGGGVSKVLLLDFLALKILPHWSFASMSIIPSMIQYYKLGSIEEFRVRYYVSRVGFDKIWSSKDRSSVKATEEFYNEHDADLWRQAYLSKYQYMYKKKILLAYHIAKKVKARKVLDYGCGAGVLGIFLHRQGFSVDMADIPSKTLDFVKKQMPMRTFTIDANLVLPKEYDFISCLDALEHTFTPLQITKRLLASLKKGGVFYVNFPREGDGHGDNEHHQHTKEAQVERPATFDYLREICEEIVPEKIYRKY